MVCNYCAHVCFMALMDAAKQNSGSSCRRTMLAHGTCRVNVQSIPQSKTKSLQKFWRLLLYGESDDDLLSHGRTTLSSALFRFTALFGMGRGGARTLWSSDITLVAFATRRRNKARYSAFMASGRRLASAKLPEL